MTVLSRCWLGLGGGSPPEDFNPSVDDLLHLGGAHVPGLIEDDPDVCSKKAIGPGVATLLQAPTLEMVLAKLNGISIANLLARDLTENSIVPLQLLPESALAGASRMSGQRTGRGPRQRPLSQILPRLVLFWP